jgi:hypothetical protein
MDELLKSWREREHHSNKLFVTDGIVDSEAWGQANHKVLFILKEAYDTTRTEGTWDLSGFIKRRKVSGRTFKPLAQWACGIQHVLENRQIAEFKEDGEEVEKAIMASAVINLKKSGGTKSSSEGNLQEYVEKDWDLITRQIEIIQPDIVICGNTWSLFSKLIEEKSKISDLVTDVGGVPYVDFWHPANRAANRMNYYSLCALVLLSLQSGGL